MRQQNIPALVQIMARRLFGAKPLSETMSTAILPIRPKGAHLSDILLKIQKFHLGTLDCNYVHCLNYTLHIWHIIIGDLVSQW